MPNLRDYTTQARRLNTRMWSHQEPRTRIETWLNNAEEMFAENAHRAQAGSMAERRGRLVREIEEVSMYQAMFAFSVYVRNHIVTTNPDEANEVLRTKLLRAKKKACHWSRDPGSIVDLKEALTFVRYFRRYGKVIWGRKAV